jgi:hypothetical protein
MRKLPLAPSIVLALLVFTVFAAAAEAVTVTYTPRPGAAGSVFVVVDFPREGGLARPARVSIDTGTVRNFSAVPYGRCDEISPSGFVIRLKRWGPGPIRITTTGTIIRGPYQGEPPLELLHTCYRVQK